ncbi:MAG: signal peptidase I [Acidimicrobiaceae bacterium]|nr:signal peptidase I [Acidimicrobiaceae bacterium]
MAIPPATSPAEPPGSAFPDRPTVISGHRAPAHRKPPPWWRRHIIGWGVPLVVAIVLAILLRTFVVGTFSIPSGSMIPTLKVGDRIAVDKLSMHMGGIHRGDIIVFHRTRPTLCNAPAEQYLVKRVIGLPGDHLSSTGNPGSSDSILVNGKPLNQSWLPKNDPLTYPVSPVTVPAGEYYVMGDNRAASCDSRFWGEVPRGNIVGRVILRYWPLSRIHFF